ncbi:MAG: tetratricopeptide repeat protein [Chloroflexota bacterium]
MNIQCKNCGFDNPANMRFCGNCGLRLLATGRLPTVGLVPEQEPVSRLGEMVGADLLDRFRQAGLEAAGQRRQVTVLFVDLSGYTHLSEQLNDSEQLYELVQRCTKMFANDVYKYDGIVDKFTGDGLMALFGAPIAHENNAELAIRAALDMQADLESLSTELKEQLGSEIRAHIGLHSGSVVVGGIGSNMMMNYTAIGDVVNLANRIESAANSGTILVSDVVYRQVRTLFNFETVEPLMLKGISQPVIAHRVLNTKSKPGSVRGIEGLYAPMVGRDGELERLHQAVKATVREKVGRFIAVSGEAGIGKSRLILEFKTSLSQLPVQMLEGASLIYRKGVSYWVFQDMILHMIGADAETSKAEIQVRLQECVAQSAPDQIGDILPYLEQMLSLPFSTPETAKRIDYLSAEQLRQQIFLAVRDLILAVTQQKPVVLILEDLHWADSGSLELLAFLLDSLVKKPVVILAVARSFADGKLAEIASRAGELLHLRFTDLSLKSLSPDQSDQLLSQLLKIQNMPEALRTHIVQRASGIPLYLEEILRMLMDRNLLYRVEDHWQLIEKVDLALLGVPDTLEGLILTRFDHLELLQRYILKVASVIGRSFTRSLLIECMPNLTSAEIDISIRVLLDREFILPDPLPGGEYMFKHVLVADTIYSTLLKRERKELHGRVADTIEKLFADHLETQIDVLARHYFWSDREERALHYLILAGEKSARNYNTGQAQKYFEDALSLLSTVKYSSQQALQVYIGLGDALAVAGNYPETRAAYERAALVIVGDEKANAEIACSVQRKIGMTHERQGDYDQALVCLNAGQKLLLDAGLDSPAELSQILNDTGWIYFRRSNLDEAEKHLMQALVLAEIAARLDVVSSVYNRLGGVLYQKNQLKLARDFVAKSISIREELGDILGVARSYNNLGILSWKTGAWDEALKNLKRSVELQNRLGDVESIIELNSNLGLLQIDRGYTDDARQYLEKALNQAEQIGYYFHIGLSNHHMGMLFNALGDWQSALEYSLRSETIFKKLDEKTTLVDVYVNLGNIYLGTHDLRKAAQYGEQALELYDEFTAEAETEIKGCALRLLGDIALATENYDEAEKQYRQAEVIFDTADNQLEIGRLLMSKARLALLTSNQKFSESYIVRAQMLFEQLGARLDLDKLDVLKADMKLQ